MALVLPTMAGRKASLRSATLLRLQPNREGRATQGPPGPVHRTLMDTTISPSRSTWNRRCAGPGSGSEEELLRKAGRHDLRPALRFGYRPEMTTPAGEPPRPAFSFAIGGERPVEGAPAYAGGRSSARMAISNMNEPSSSSSLKTTPINSSPT